jgi:phosphotransferase system enzyme I (PtsP)
VEELRAARAMVDLELNWAVRRGRPAPSRLEVGAMLEAPALIWHLDALLPMTDFVSVGTNDLMQYLFAADRGNPKVADRYDPLSPPALRALRQIQEACAETGTPVSICGEMAGKPLEAFALVALGFDRLSMPPTGVGPVKQMVLSLDRTAAQKGMLSLIRSASGSVREEITTLARKLHVAI